VETLRLVFDQGTLRLEGLAQGNNGVPGALWDQRTGCWRAPAYRYAQLAATLRADGRAFETTLDRHVPSEGRWETPPLRPYQEDALDGWRASAHRGLVVLPTGAGKTRIAIAAIAEANTSSVVLCPTRALLAQWQQELQRWYSGPIGVVGDGAFDLQPITVMTFESGWRHLDRLGDRFHLVVADEVHHLSSGSRSEVLEMLPAERRLGLTATPPEAGGPGYARLGELIGPVVYEMGVGDLVGTWLADYQAIRRGVRLTDEERNRYDADYIPFAETRRVWVRAHPGEDWPAFMKSLASTRQGREVLEGYHRASSLASCPDAKRKLVSRLLDRHRDTKTLVFTAFADHAYDISRDNLIPVITAEIGRAERTEILARFADGSLRAVVSARVLNEGIDVPDATVAIVVAGTLGVREHIQRIGRVLRPRPGKKALIYELVTNATIDDIRAQGRKRRYMQSSILGESAPACR
jgi:superfamily II DNA or RNA helicase